MKPDFFAQFRKQPVIQAVPLVPSVPSVPERSKPQYSKALSKLITGTNPQNPFVPSYSNPQEIQDYFDERSAFLEFSGGYSREEAERIANLEILDQKPLYFNNQPN